MKALVRCYRSVESPLSRPLAVLHDLKPMGSRNYTKDAKDLRQSGLFFYPQPWLVYIAREGEEIDFAGGMALKSDTEMDRHSRNLGDGSRRNNGFGLIASHNYKISWD